MKKVFTISVTILFIISGLPLTLARHDCGGNLAAVRISLAGEKATCGMETDDEERSDLILFTQECCDDHISSLCVENDYFPQYYNPINEVREDSEIDFRINFSSGNYLLNSCFPVKVFPPGNNHYHRLSQPDICIFRT